MNLVTLSLYARRAIAIIVTLIVLYILAFLLKAPAKTLYTQLFPPKDPPTIKYGLLEPLKFIEKPIRGTTGNFTLNTQNGRLPNNLPVKLPVYKLTKPRFSYEAGKNAQRHATVLGFSDNELITDLKGEVYRWKDVESSAQLEIRTQTKELELITNFVGKDADFTRGSLTESRVSTNAKTLLGTLNRFFDETYTREDGKISYAKIENGQLVKTDSSFDAELARVDFFRKLRETPVVTPDFYRGLISVTMRTDGVIDPPALKYPLISYHEWQVDPDESGTYPLITVAEAWRAVAQEKKGVIANVIPNNKSELSQYESTEVHEVFIRNIYLAYYDTYEYQALLQPIYVFEGDYNVNNRPGGRIVFYFPAVQAQYVKPVAENPATPIIPTQP